jgi:hypothetical protein
MMNLRRTAWNGAIVAACGLGVGSGVCGCVGYHSYPPTPEQRARESMGERAPVDVMVLALERTLLLHPAPGASGFVVNLPMTISPDRYAMVAERVGGQPLTPSTAALPTYHVAGVRVRNGKAWVDVVWPAGEGIDRSTTVWLEGGMQPWEVTRVQEWNSGVIPTPEPYYIMRADEVPVQPEATEPAQPNATAPDQPAAEPAPTGGSPE